MAETLLSCQFGYMYTSEEVQLVLAAGGSTGFLYIMNACSLKIKKMPCHKNEVYQIKFAQENAHFCHKNLVLTSSKDGLITLSNILHKTIIALFKDKFTTYPTNDILSVSWHLSQRYFASCSNN